MENNGKLKELFSIAIEIFGKYGYKKTTVEDIAKEMGWTKGAIYQYVDGKRDLYEKALRYQMQHWHTSVLASIKNINNTDSKFKILCKAAFSYLDRNKSFKKIIATDPDVFPMSFEDDPYAEINEKSMSCLEEVIVAGIKEGKFKEIDSKIASRFIFSVYKMVIVTTYSLGSSKTNRIIDTAVEIISKGIYK